MVVVRQRSGVEGHRVSRPVEETVNVLYFLTAVFHSYLISKMIP